MTTNRFSGIEGSHFQRLRVAFLELVKLASHGDAISPGERKTLEDIAIGFVARETEVRIHEARSHQEILELAREQLIELGDAEIQHLIDGLNNIEPADDPLLDQFRDPRPRVFLKFMTPRERADLRTREIRKTLAQPQTVAPVIDEKMAIEAADKLLREARLELQIAMDHWAKGVVLPKELESIALAEIITRAACTWSALRFKQ